MNVGFFLKSRIAFIRQLYNTASAPYIERKRKIEAEEDPFVPPYSEDDEPAFLEEWIEADESLHVLAYSCVSMLAAALHLYLKTWERQFGIHIDKSDFKKGWLKGYTVYFARHAGIQFDDSQVDLKMLEEIVLARNLVQHPECIVSPRTHYTDDDLKKLPRPFFVDDRDSSLLVEVDEEEKSWLSPPTLHVTGEKLSAAIAEVERFTTWLDAEVEAHVYRR